MACMPTQHQQRTSPPLSETFSPETSSFYPTESSPSTTNERPPPNLTPISSSTSETPHSNTYAMMMPYPMMPPPPSVPLKGIVHPHPHDVLCGRGGQSNIHPGNTQWRLLVAANKELYVTLPKKQKMMLSQSIVNAVRSQVPSGRFLQKDMHNDLWYDVGDKRAQEKTSQALREGAPEIRDKLKANEVVTEGEETALNAPPEPIPSTASIVVQKDAEGPPPLDQSPSQEQMPPPRTVQERTTTEQKMAKSSPQRAPKEDKNNTKASYFEPPPYRPDGYTDAHAVVVEPIPLPQAFAEAHASCSFGSIGLLSDMEQAKLMNSFFTNKTDEAPQQHSQQYPQQQPHHSGYPPPPGSYYPQHHPYPPHATSEYPPPADPNYYYSSNYQHHHPPTSSAYGQVPAEVRHDPPSSAQQYDPVPQPVDQGLEPVGLSMGSAMSFGTMGPPEVNYSFGSSAMSYTYQHARRGSRSLAPSAPDGGLQDVGMSLGSLSLADGDRERIIAEAERDIAALMGGSDTLPTLLHQQKSKGNLLECSDSEEEDEDGTSAEASAQRSQEHWTRMKATLAERDESIRNNLLMPTTVELTQHRPPPAAGPWYPSSLDRDFSQMSAISVGEDFDQVPGYHGRSLRFSDGIPPGTVLQFEENVPEPGAMPPPLSES